jgi:orotidine-5'-phosphate decarboxylase
MIYRNQHLSSISNQPRLFEHVHLANGPLEHQWTTWFGRWIDLPHEIERVRAIAPELPLLIPGIGAQGGDAIATIKQKSCALSRDRHLLQSHHLCL